MKIKFFAFVAGGIFIFFSGCQKNETIETTRKNVLVEVSNGDIIPGQYIVVLKEDVQQLKSTQNLSYVEKTNAVRALAESMITTKSASDYEVGQAYAQVLKGFSVKISEENLNLLKNDDRIKYIEPDMHILRPPWEDPNPDDGAEQQIPYGINRVGHGSGVGKVAWIIDSGIDLDHPDLNVDVTRSVDFTGSRVGADDENGHGTHCAGIVAALDNEIGVVGVASGATLIAVRVLDRRGNGTTSGVIAGVDYVAANASSGDAANMSIGGGISTTLDDAVLAASNNGIYFSLASGNESDDANNHSPARVNGSNIWTISAMDINDNWASFSNYGNPPVDYCEPGVSIYSTYKSGGYATLSGTSMAAPHMCGILLMTNGNPSTDGYVNNDPDGNADPIGAI